MVEIRPLGSTGLRAPCQGLGMMGATAFYAADAAADEPGALKAAAAAVELGGGKAFLDTAWIYQDFGRSGMKNETLVGKVIAEHGRDKLVVATKFGIAPGDATTPLKFDSSEPLIRRQLAESLHNLGTDYIDLYYQHRVDPATPVDVTFAAVRELIRAGKVRHAGMSECTPAELRLAHSVCPIAAIQIEWSLQTRDCEAALVPCARELGVGIVAYSPLGRGLLSGTFAKRDELAAGDWRASNPRFSAEAFDSNASAAAKIAEIGTRLGLTPAQVALAWVHSRGRDVFPIPGAKREAHVRANLAAASVVLTAEDAAAIEAAVPAAVGDRYVGMGGTFNSRMAV